MPASEVELAIVMALTRSNWHEIQRMRPLGEQLTEVERLVIAHESPEGGSEEDKCVGDDVYTAMSVVIEVSDLAEFSNSRSRRHHIHLKTVRRARCCHNRYSFSPECS